jgi:hypothetical protein
VRALLPLFVFSTLAGGRLSNVIRPSMLEMMGMKNNAELMHCAIQHRLIE